MVFRCQTNCKHQPFILTQPYSHGGCTVPMSHIARKSGSKRHDQVENYWCWQGIFICQLHIINAMLHML